MLKLISKKTIILIITFLLLDINGAAQIPLDIIPTEYEQLKPDSPIGDISGKWLGKSYQFDCTGKNVLMELEIKAKIEQTGEKITGHYSLKGFKGIFGKFVFEGTIKNNMPNLEKFDIKTSILPKNTEWCEFKSAKMDIINYNDTTYLIGDILSYEPGTNNKCTPVYVILKKKEEIKDNIKNLALKADELDDFFMDNFGCEMSAELKEQKKEDK